VGEQRLQRRASELWSVLLVFLLLAASGHVSLAIR